MIITSRKSLGINQTSKSSKKLVKFAKSRLLLYVSGSCLNAVDLSINKELVKSENATAAAQGTPATALAAVPGSVAASTATVASTSTAPITVAAPSTVPQAQNTTGNAKDDSNIVLIGHCPTLETHSKVLVADGGQIDCFASLLKDNIIAYGERYSGTVKIVRWSQGSGGVGSFFKQ